MNVTWHSLLADNGSPLGILQWLIPVIVAVLIVISRLLKKAKEMAEREEAQRRQPPTRTPAESQQARRRQQVTAQEAMSALREILGVEPEMQQPPPPPTQQPPVLRPAPGPARAPKRPPEPRVRRAQRRRLVPGEGVRRQVEHRERELAAGEVERRRRLPELEQLRTRIGGAGEGQRDVRVRVNLTDRSEAVRAILYSEILGPPKALRRGPESWER